MKVVVDFHPRPGLAVLAALTALVFVAIAITALSAAVSDDARNSINQTASAQLEQMLLAGAYDARIELNSGIQADHSWNVELPSDLAEQKALLKITASQVQSDQAIFKIIAQLNRNSLTQTVHFQNNNGNWTLTSAELE